MHNKTVNVSGDTAFLTKATRGHTSQLDSSCDSHLKILELKKNLLPKMTLGGHQQLKAELSHVAVLIMLKDSYIFYSTSAEFFNRPTDFSVFKTEQQTCVTGAIGHIFLQRYQSDSCGALMVHFMCTQHTM